MQNHFLFLSKINRKVLAHLHDVDTPQTLYFKKIAARHAASASAWQRSAPSTHLPSVTVRPRAPIKPFPSPSHPKLLPIQGIFYSNLRAMIPTRFLVLLSVAILARCQVTAPAEATPIVGLPSLTGQAIPPTAEGKFHLRKLGDLVQALEPARAANPCALRGHFFCGGVQLCHPKDHCLCLQPLCLPLGPPLPLLLPVQMQRLPT